MPASTDVKFFHCKMKNMVQYDGSKGSIINWTNALLVDGFNEQTATSVSVSGNVATVNLAGHGYWDKTVISISGATPAQLNGEHRITKVYNDSFQFETVGVVDGAATGTIKVKNAPAGWKKVAQSADGFKAVYKSDRLGFDQPFFMVDDTEDRGHGFKVFAMSWFDNFERYDKQMEGLYRTRFIKKGQYQKWAWAVLANDHFFYELIDNNSTSYNKNGNFSLYSNEASATIQLFGAMKTTKANNKYNAVIGGLAEDSNNFNPSTVLDSRNSFTKSVSYTGSFGLIQRDYTSIGAPKNIGIGLPYQSAGRNSSYTFGVVNAPDFAVYVQRPIIVGDSVAYGYLPGLYYTPMSFHPHDTEPTFIENVAQIQPDNTMMWWPTGQGGVYFNATKW